MKAGPPAVLLLGDTLRLGGTEGQLVEIACRLDRSRWDIHVSCLRAEGPLRARLEAAGVHPWSCGKGSFKSPRFLIAVWGMTRYLRTHRIRLIHCFDVYSNVLGVLAARLAAVPAIIASQRDLGDMRSGVQRQAQNVALRLATTVLVNAEAIQRRLVHERIVPAKRIVVIRNGADLTRYSPSPQPWNSASPSVIGTVANLRPEKGLDHLLRAAALVSRHTPTVRFAIWGDGPLRQNLESLAKELAVDHVTSFPGHTPSVRDVLREMRIFVFPPTLNEGVSNSLLEAMAVGLPVVATSVGGNVELVDDEKTGLLVPPGEPDGLAKAIIRLIEEPALAARLGARARDRVRAEFSIDQLLVRLQTLYDQLLTRSVD